MAERRGRRGTAPGKLRPAARPRVTAARLRVMLPRMPDPDRAPMRWRMLALLSLAELLGMSLWFEIGRAHV